jgi:xanthine dehydrogenase YagS FAD-binding subunit
MGTVGGNLLQSTRCWYWRLGYECRLRGGDRCHARDGEHREHAILANDFCASAHPSDVAAALVALGARVRTTVRELPVADLYRIPNAADPRTVALEPGEVLLELEVPPADASTYLKAMDRKRFGFPLVGVAAVRRGEATTVALAGVAPVPWLLEDARESALDNATPLPGTAWKVEVARAFLARALASIGAE